ncbi:hypothetical protein BamIOP4010DRAFT_6649 [Burkholderia ambifaria IOP40-10]|uniref:Uncharacterized protein n=1 Tax=Burkholderia ambifaria IOP40-10 TaxID=396596 RepID=B1FRI8_9BURK|nr:hypothetical protein BamIOP4010DRAFT_6649 [Burkholderia ambifaria IOP40-10]
MPGCAKIPNRLDVLITWPSPDAFRCGRNAFVPCTTPQKLMFTIHSRSLYSSPSIVLDSATPALLKIRLTLPCSFAVSSAHANIASRSPTSSTRVDTRTFGAIVRTIRSVSARPMPFLSASDTWQPACASWIASERPMPEPAPVIAATLLAKSLMSVAPCLAQAASAEGEVEAEAADAATGRAVVSCRGAPYAW